MAASDLFAGASENALPYKLYAGQNLMFKLNDFSDALDEMLNFIETTPNNAYFYDQFEISKRVHDQNQG